MSALLRKARPFARALSMMLALSRCSPASDLTSLVPSTTDGRAPSPTTSTMEAAVPTFFREQVVDVVVRNGSLIDGSGSPAQTADVVLEGDRVLFVGAVAREQKARLDVDASGLWLAPGFIDLHSHQAPFTEAPQLHAMGVTTVVLGQDGESPAQDIGAFLDSVHRRGSAVNIATLSGHSSLRAELARGEEKGRKDETGVERAASLASLVRRDLERGAFGLSLGLEYDGARGTDAQELSAALEPVGKAKRVAMAHLRSEDDDQVDAALAEFLGACEHSGARAHVAHLKVVLGRGQARAESLLQQLAQARARGLEVSADLYPYTASYTTLAILFPPSARPPNDYKRALRKQRAAIREHLRARVISRNGPEATVFGPGRYQGKTLAEVAAERRRPFEDILLGLGPYGGEAAYHVMDEEVVFRLARDPFVAFGTDASGESSHPRSHGTFARALGPLVRDAKLFSLEEAVRKSSGLSASLLGLADRGQLQAGKAADLVVFDATRITDRADFIEPHRHAEGVLHVWVNGQLVRRDGKPVAFGKAPGRALRPAQKL